MAWIDANMRVTACRPWKTDVAQVFVRLIANAGTLTEALHQQRCGLL
jgi:hypothetical protein